MKRRSFRIWVRQTFVALLRPFSELRVSHGMRTVKWFDTRRVVSSIPLEVLQAHVTLDRCYSRRDLRVMREEIARKRVLLVMGYPSFSEIKGHYKLAALGKKTDAECKAFEARLVVKP